MNNLELLTSHEGRYYYPAVEEGIVWETERRGSPGKLTFSAVNDGMLLCEEGDPVRLTVNGTGVFYGFVFTKKQDKDALVKYTCYDQLRYLKNKDTYVYENKTASELLRMIAGDFNLQTGAVDDTGYKIASRVESDVALIDMIENALDLTLQNRKKIYVMYDDFGKIALRDVENMKLELLIDEETGQNFDYTSSIDENTYNQVKLVYENEKTGKRDVYMTKHSENINRWGVLQYFETITEQTNGQAKAEALLSLYNRKTRKLKITGAFGDVRVRAGTSPIVALNLVDIRLMNYMMVEQAKHTFRNFEHTMDLTLRGGDFVA